MDKLKVSIISIATVATVGAVSALVAYKLMNRNKNEKELYLDSPEKYFGEHDIDLLDILEKENDKLEHNSIWNYQKNLDNPSDYIIDNEIYNDDFITDSLNVEENEDYFRSNLKGFLDEEDEEEMSLKEAEENFKLPEDKLDKESYTFGKGQ